MIKVKKFKIKQGFTMIELLIAIFIFSTVMIIASSSMTTSLLSGKTHAKGSLAVNQSLNLILDNIGQKMVNASGKNGTIYGFNEVGGRLTIVAGDNNTCTYFDQDSDAIKMLQQNCAAAIPGMADVKWQKISSPNLKITNADFSFPSKNEWSAAKTAPWIVIKVAGQDIKTGEKTSVESAYSIPAYTYNKW